MPVAATPSETAARAPGRLRRWLWQGKAKWLTLAGGFFLLLAALFALATWSSHRRLETYWAAERAAGRAATFDELLGPPLADDENASVAMNNVAASATACHSLAVAKLKDGANHAGQWRESDWRDFSEAWEAANPRFAAALAEADRRPRARSLTLVDRDNPINTLQPHVQDWRNVARLEPTLAYAQALHGDRDGALRRLARLLRINRKVAGCEPFLVAMLVGIACDGVAMLCANEIVRLGPCGAEALRELDVELARREDRTGFFAALQSEKLSLRPGMASDFPAAPAAWLDANAEVGLRLIDRAAAEHREPLLARHAFEDEVKRLRDGLWRRAFHAPAALFLPALNRVGDADERRRACARCLRVILARHRQGDDLPLERLGLPPEALRDPIDGQPLRVRGRGNKLVVYSVAEDGKDDGGVNLLPANYGNAAANFDWGFGPPP